MRNEVVRLMLRKDDLRGLRFAFGRDHELDRQVIIQISALVRDIVHQRDSPKWPRVLYLDDYADLLVRYPKFSG